MLPQGIVPLADYVMLFYRSEKEMVADVDDDINKFLKEHPAFYINLISALSDSCVAVVFEGPADEVKKLRGEEL